MFLELTDLSSRLSEATNDIKWFSQLANIEDDELIKLCMECYMDYRDERIASVIGIEFVPMRTMDMLEEWYGKFEVVDLINDDKTQFFKFAYDCLSRDVFSSSFSEFQECETLVFDMFTWRADGGMILMNNEGDWRALEWEREHLDDNGKYIMPNN